MYAHDVPEARATDPDDRAHDHIAAATVRACAPEDIAATLRVLRTMADRAHVDQLAQKVSWDPSGNPLARTPAETLAWGTMIRAHELIERLEEVADSLEAASSENSPSKMIVLDELWTLVKPRLDDDEDPDHG